MEECLEKLMFKTLEDSSNKTSNYELEIRIGHHPEAGQQFCNNIGSNLFSNVMKRLNTNVNWARKKHESTVDYFDFSANTRLTVVNETGEEKCVVKRRIYTQDFRNFEGTSFTVRVSLSTEEPVSGHQSCDEVDLSRTKDRMSYWHINKYGHTWRFDLTMVSTDDGRGSNTAVSDLDEDHGPLTHEIELEFDHSSILGFKGSSKHVKYASESTVMKVRDLIEMLKT